MAARPVMLTPLGNLAILKEDRRYLEANVLFDKNLSVCLWVGPKIGCDESH